jgi:hypothetical protein
MLRAGQYGSFVHTIAWLVLGASGTVGAFAYPSSGQS